MSRTSDALDNVRQAIRRLNSDIDDQFPVIDTDRVEAAFAAHFRELGMPPLPVLWFHGIKEGLLVADDEGMGKLGPTYDIEWGDREGKARGATRVAVYDELWQECKVEGILKLWTNHDNLIWSTVHNHLNDVPWGRGLPVRGRTRLIPQQVPRRRTLERIQNSGISVSCHRYVAEALAWGQLEENPGRHETVLSEISRMTRIFEPFIEAYEAGLWMFWVVPGKVIAIPRPSTRHRDGRLHNETGPAIFWEDDHESYYFWRGVEVPEEVILRPRSIPWERIDKEFNLEVRRVMIERYGVDRYIIDSGAREIHRDRRGVLYRKELIGDEPIVMVKVRNSTPEPDGTYKDYFIRVPPDITTASQAVAWTFGFDNSENYFPGQET